MPAIHRAALSAEIQDRKRIVPLATAAELRGVSVDTLKRREPEKIIRLSPRRLGMRLADALLLTDSETA